MPSWNKTNSDDELEYQRMMKKRGAAEERQMGDNLVSGDIFGEMDGRPGIGVGFDGTVYMPFHWRVILWLGGVALLLLFAFGTRACLGEERAEQIRNEGQQGQQ